MKKKQEKSLIKPRNHEEAEIQRLRNALGTTFVTFQDGADLEPTHRQPLFSISRALEHAQAADEHTEWPTTQLESLSFVNAIIRPLIEQP